MPGQRHGSGAWKKFKRTKKFIIYYESDCFRLGYFIYSYMMYIQLHQNVHIYIYMSKRATKLRTHYCEKIRFLRRTFVHPLNHSTFVELFLSLLKQCIYVASIKTINTRQLLSLWNDNFLCIPSTYLLVLTWVRDYLSV